MLSGVLYIMGLPFLCCTRLKDFGLVDLVKIIHRKFPQNSYKIHKKSPVEVSDLFEVAWGVESIMTIYYSYSSDSLISITGVRAPSPTRMTNFRNQHQIG